MKKRKLIILIAITLMLSFSFAVFAWFYFPNSKGLEIDTAPALDFDIEVYKVVDLYDEKGNYTSSRLDNLTDIGSYENSSGETIEYLDTENAIFTVPDSFEFYQWGDEFICEDAEVHYYALKISYDSDAYYDGYIKSIIAATLNSSGSFETDQVYDANFPVVKTSYKFASSATIMDLEASAISEMKDVSDYKEIINGTDYFLKSGDNYILVDRKTPFDEEATYYTSTITKVYGITSANFGSEVRYTFDSSTNTFVKQNAYAANTQYYSGEFSQVSIQGYAKSDDNYSLALLNYDIETVFKDELDPVQYVINTTNKIQFVLFIKLEPDEVIVTRKMDELADVIGDLTEINVINRLTLDVMLRSVPHKEGTISNN